MADFNKSYLKLYPLEKKYCNDKNDSGGETKYGISKKQYPQLNIVDLTEEEAIEILKRDYWDFYNLSLLDNQELANAVFIMFVNTKPLGVAMCLQLAIHACGGKEIQVDGILGSQTLRLANSINPTEWLIERFKVEEIRYYLGIVDSNISQQPNLRSWIRRAIS